MDTLVFSDLAEWLAPLSLVISFLSTIVYLPLMTRARTERCPNCGKRSAIEAATCVHCGESTLGRKTVLPWLGLMLLAMLASGAAMLLALISALPYHEPPLEKLLIAGAGLTVLIGLLVISGWGRNRSANLKRKTILNTRDFYGGFCAHCGNEMLGGTEICHNCQSKIDWQTPNWTADPKSLADPAVKAKPVQAKIICTKCKTENPGGSGRCSRCGRDLLTFKPVWLRMTYFLVSLLFAAGLAWLAYQTASNPNLANLMELIDVGIIALALGVVISPFYGLYLAFGRGSYDELLTERAERHNQKFPWQSLNDYSLALKLAPSSKHAKILDNRKKLYASLGLEQNATRDELAITYARENDPQGGVGLFLGEKIFGGPGDSFARGHLSGIAKRARKDRKRMFETGRIIAVGYCPSCNEVVQLDQNLQCPRATAEGAKKHSGAPKYIQYVVPADIQAGKDHVPQAMAAGKKKNTRRIWTVVIALLLIMASCYFVPMLIK